MKQFIAVRQRRRRAGAAARVGSGGIAVAVGLVLTVFAAPPSRGAMPIAAPNGAMVAATVGTTEIDHLPGLGGIDARRQGGCEPADTIPIAVVIGGVEIDHFPGLSGGAITSLSLSTR